MDYWAKASRIIEDVTVGHDRLLVGGWDDFSQGSLRDSYIQKNILKRYEKIPYFGPLNPV
jgi:hypothetical protein